jgi:F-box-like
MLSNLPLEILWQIFADFPAARDLRNLSLTCHALYHAVRQGGWRVFVKSRFPSLSSAITPDTSSMDAAKGLVALSRNWDRRALVARDLPSIGMIMRGPDPYIFPRQRNRLRNSGQTMGFIPVIDSFEEMVGGDWSRRKELVVWAAGTKLAFRCQTKNTSIEEYNPYNVRPDRQGKLSRWGVYHDRTSREGRDDFTALKLIIKSERAIEIRDGMPCFSVLVGTASGNLSILDITPRPYSTSELSYDRKKTLQTSSNSSIRSADLSPSQRLVLSATANGTVNIFDIRGNAETILPLSSHHVTSFGHLWTARFLSEDTIAVGTGQSNVPLQVYRLTPTGIMEIPLRVWGADNGNISWESLRHIPVSTVTSILPLPSCSSSNSGRNFFLSGRTQGSILLHDLRSPRNVDAEFFDPVDPSTVYSLVSKGRERIVAGASRNTLLKFFDLRMSGGRNYTYTTGLSDANRPQSRKGRHSYGWSIFVRPQDQQSQQHQFGTPARYQHGLAGNTQANRQDLMSPTYSISTPSLASSTLYTGLMERIVQMDIVDLFDRFPDPVHRTLPINSPSPSNIWDGDYLAIELSTYDHDDPSQLRKQIKSWLADPNVPDTGLDVRWKNLSDSNVIDLA